MTANTEPIVAGVDGSAQSRGAARWALREAGMRHRPLRIVCAPDVTGEEQLGWARTIVDDAVIEARRCAPGLPIEGAVLAGPPVAALLAESEHAALMVVASRGSGGFEDPHTGSVADQIVRYARSAVMVVHHAEAWAPLGASLTSARAVVVGVDNAAESDLAVGFAFEEAQARGVPVVAVRGWRPADEPSLAVQRRLLTASLAGWRAKYPYLTVRRRVVPAPPIAALLSVARDADLVVVGSRDAGGCPAELLGSVNEQLLHHAPCAVVVVHGDAAELAAEPAANGRPATNC